MNGENLNNIRHAFGQFATGVTIVTTAGRNREPIGVTANSFNSVSLHPPMVLLSLTNKAKSRVAFEQSKYFCTHVLTASQCEMSERFVCRGEDKFGSVNWSWGGRSLRILDDYEDRFQCRNSHQYAVGDHIVFVGEVLSFDETNKRQWVFHRSQYAVAERRIVEHLACDVGDRSPESGDRRKRR